MLLELVQPFLWATVSLELSETSIYWEFLLQSLQPVRLGLFTGPSTIAPSLHRLRPCIFKLFTPIASFSYATWSSANEQQWALNLRKFQLAISFTACTIWVFQRSVHVCTFVAPTEGLYFSTLYTSSFILIFFLSFLFVASLLGEYTWRVECSRLVDEYFGSFLFKIGDVMDEERLRFQIVNPVDP